MFKFNSRKCNSASFSSGCAYRDKTKCCIALPKDAGHVKKKLEKSLIGGISCVNTRLAFDTEILLGDQATKKFYLTSMEKTNKTYFVQNFKNGREQPIRYGHDKTITAWLYQKIK